jgi:hypothetical protein
MNSEIIDPAENPGFAGNSSRSEEVGSTGSMNSPSFSEIKNKNRGHSKKRRKKIIDPIDPASTPNGLITTDEGVQEALRKLKGNK